ncbi:MAG: prephenate dehydratase [Nitrososphaera sp.]|uniref:prephenate dehydratase n=1 Tax=Nitrososphaera sp. TaxID=1971748 RepID=UPI003D6E123A
MARVAFQGERGAYSEMAALQYFPGATLVPKKSFSDAFSAVEEKKAGFAVIPVENSIEGSVGEVYDLLAGTRLAAVGEVHQRVRHCLIANRGVKMGDVKVAYSHPQALGQCRAYLQKKKMQAMPAYDTAGSVKMVKEQKLRDAAAIASRRAAELYGMEILDEGIEDRKNNYTRFLVMSPAKKLPKSDGSYKTSIIFSVKHVPGALFGILGEFAIGRLNLTKIESRPTKETPWEYNFYVDFEGHAADAAAKKALAAIRGRTSYLKVLGSYKKAESA